MCGVSHQMLLHAVTCEGCASEGCRQLRALLHHGNTCQVRHQGGCGPCRRIWAILQYHAKQCQRETCACLAMQLHSLLSTSVAQACHIRDYFMLPVLHVLLLAKALECKANSALSSQ
eukprot:9860-Heterococcus_DN1.PRE.2